jgi:hypothetical protein
MHDRIARVLLVLTCLVFGVVSVSTTAAASSKKKKHAHKTHHHASKPAKAGAGSTKAAGAAPAEEADEDEGGESAEDDEKQDDAKAKPKTKASGADEGAREAAGEKGGDDDDDGDASVVHHKAKRSVADEGGAAAPVAIELSAGPRAIHRTFDFNDPLSDHVMGARRPNSYVLPAGPAPFVDLGLYPLAFATRGFLANIGLIARYEKLLGTKTSVPEGSTAPALTTFGQQLEVGARVRLPLGAHEVGIGGSYGKHSFHVTETDPGPGPDSTVPNVDYTFIGVGADARLRLSPIEIGAHVGTRFVSNTGSLAKQWFNTTKTTSIAAGVSIGYQLSPLFEVVAGADFLRYAFDFNPVDMTSPVIAGGAVDQYLSGFLALRVSISGG